MTRPESTTPDRPFPGAHSQVPGAQTLLPPSEAAGTAGGRATLPLESVPQPGTGRGWAVRLRVRAEEVTVSKQVVIRERVVIRRAEVEGVEHVEANVRREELRVSTEGSTEVVDPRENRRGRRRALRDA